MCVHRDECMRVYMSACVCTDAQKTFYMYCRLINPTIMECTILLCMLCHAGDNMFGRKEQGKGNISLIKAIFNEEAVRVGQK